MEYQKLYPEEFADYNSRADKYKLLVDSYKSQVSGLELVGHLVARLFRNNLSRFENEVVEGFNERRGEDLERRLEYDFLMSFKNLRN